MIPTVSVLLGYFIIFFPILFRKQKKYLEDKYNKFSRLFLMSYSFIITLLICLLLIVINCYHPFNLISGIIITILCTMIFIIFGLLILLNINKKVIKYLMISNGIFIVIVSIY